MRSSVLLTPIVLLLAACAPALRPLPPTSPMRPLPEPPAESPAPPEAPVDSKMPAPLEMMAPELEALRDRGLLVPVEGILPGQIPDTFNDPRDGQRRHNAVDILAKRGTPVLAADDGVVLRVGKNTLGGNVVWAADATRSLVYYYAHLDRWASGIKEGSIIARGSLLGYVGTTGNAPKNVPHLHFQLLRMTDLRRFTDGPPINPLPFFLSMTGVSR